MNTSATRLADAPQTLHLLAGGTAADRRAAHAQVIVGWLLRRGGALAQDLYDAEGQPLGAGPLWAPVPAGLVDWRLSAAAPAAVVELRAALGADPVPADLRLSVRPASPGDVLFWQALADLLAESALGSQWVAVDALLADSPLATLNLAGAASVDWARLEPLLTGGWLPAYLGGHWVRGWLAADARRGWLGRDAEELLNQRLGPLLEGLYAWWAERRPEHLRILVRYLASRLRQGGGPAGILRVARLDGWGERTQAEREAFEARVGRVFALGPRLLALADELRGLGWQRTPAEEALVGCIASELEPRGEALTRLYHELCQIA